MSKEKNVKYLLSFHVDLSLELRLFLIFVRLQIKLQIFWVYLENSASCSIFSIYKGTL